MRYVEEYCKTGYATDDNIAHVQFALGARDYKHTLTKYIILFRVCGSVLLQIFK
jgi:hypothetical protein